ncbi:hypothetical protein [Sutcliffiella rhizosphaerae]|uniref:hypothetical protein n=1 Tax=Sutcliffiella rhizosphaerae TaxID=2880967 RepID=UPI001E2DE72A|nr:hypothetical protein [Sutcliffiella rhizosphaerae]
MGKSGYLEVEILPGLNIAYFGFIIGDSGLNNGYFGFIMVLFGFNISYSGFNSHIPVAGMTALSLFVTNSQLFRTNFNGFRTNSWLFGTNFSNFRTNSFIS